MEVFLIAFYSSAHKFQLYHDVRSFSTPALCYNRSCWPGGGWGWLFSVCRLHGEKEQRKGSVKWRNEGTDHRNLEFLFNIIVVLLNILVFSECFLGFLVIDSIPINASCGLSCAAVRRLNLHLSFGLGLVLHANIHNNKIEQGSEYCTFSWVSVEVFRKSDLN